MGIGEAAADVGVSYALLRERRARDEDFPKPLAMIGACGIWDVLEVREYMVRKPTLATQRVLRLSSLR